MSSLLSGRQSDSEGHADSHGTEKLLEERHDNKTKKRA